MGTRQVRSRQANVAPTVRRRAQTPGPERPQTCTGIPSPKLVAGDLLALQQNVGNRAVSRLVERSARKPTTGRSKFPLVQRHADSALEAQLEAAKLLEELPPLQRLIDPAATAVKRPLSNIAQRHALPRNRQFSGHDTPSDAQVQAAKDEIALALPGILQKMKEELAPKTPDPKKTEQMLTSKICEIDSAPDVGLGAPAAAGGTTFKFMVRSPYYYDEGGEADKPFIRATLIHEAMHCISFGHTGLQDVEFTTAEGTPGKISDPGPNDSLDEAVTEQLSLKIYDLLYPKTEYKTNYWQGLRDVGVHMTTEGMQLVADKSRAYQEKNWTGGLADLVVDEGVLDQEELETLYLMGEQGLKRKAPIQNIKTRYAEILQLWNTQKEKAWEKDLPEGVMIASDWVARLSSILKDAKDGNLSESAATDRVSHLTGGHELVSADDPRSHVYGAANKKYSNDYELLKQFYPKSARSDPRVDDTKAPQGWDKKAPVGWKGTGLRGAAKIKSAAEEQSAKLGLGGRYPHIVIPHPKDTLGATKFQDYETAVFSPKEPDISTKSMSEVSPGVENVAPARQIIENMGGDAYEMRGKVVYANSVEPRTLLHEIGHYKQDIGQINESTVNSKLLEYHNIVTVENNYGDNVEIAKRNIRLSYTGKPMVLKHGEWDGVLPDPPAAEPPEYGLLKKVATPEEKPVLETIDHALNDARERSVDVTEEKIRTRAYFIWEKSGKPDGKDHEHWLQAKAELEVERSKAPGIYTPKMQWYFRRQLASEYFKGSRFNKF